VRNQRTQLEVISKFRNEFRTFRAKHSQIACAHKQSVALVKEIWGMSNRTSTA
jgi:hypothetical protein